MQIRETVNQTIALAENAIENYEGKNPEAKQRLTEAIRMARQVAAEGEVTNITFESLCRTNSAAYESIFDARNEASRLAAMAVRYAMYATEESLFLLKARKIQLQPAPSEHGLKIFAQLTEQVTSALGADIDEGLRNAKCAK
jgi:hypothetical protein